MISYSKKLAATSISCALLIFSPVSAHENSEETEVAEKEKTKPKKITDRRHPDYVRCKSTAVIGSRIKRNRVCMTNKQWASANREGNRKSRQFVEDMQVGQNAGN